MPIDLYLASQSPRRKELLAQLGLRLRVVKAEVEEVVQPGEAPAQYALRVARAKAQAGHARTVGERPVLGADTDVVLDGQILGKPRDRGDGIRMLRALSGRAHEVYSAVAVAQGARLESALSITRVEFGEIDADAAGAYWDSGEPAGKAGAYAIQGLGAVFVREIHGSYSGVVGLPLYETCQLLAQFGIAPLNHSESRIPNPGS